MSDAFARLPELLIAHVQLSLAAIGFALLLALPLGVLAVRRPSVGALLLGAASLVQTIPALALLALFYPLLLLISSLVGGGVPALGFLPAWAALSLYALLPILRNWTTGLNGIDPAIIEAADGVGMSMGQKLRLVEAPLALPMLMAGLRTATVWTIGAATLSTTVGAPGLGDLIFAGLQTQNWALVTIGCVAAAALALVADGLLVLVESGLRHRKRIRLWTGLALLALALLAALIPWQGGAGGRPVITIGAKNFSEQYILARLFGRRLEAAGYAVRYKEGLGSSVLFAALEQGDVDIAVDYSGTLWTNEMKRGDTMPRPAMLGAIARWAQGRHVASLGSLGFENAYAFALRGADARRWKLATLDDLAARAPQLRLGSDLEFLDRPEWAAIRSAYAMQFAEARPYSPSFMYRALQSGRVDAITAFSSDGRIAAYDFVTLRDNRGAVPCYDALLLIGARHADDAKLRRIVQPLVGRIGLDLMRRANYLVDRDTGKATPEAAAAWLDQQIDLRSGEQQGRE